MSPRCVSRHLHRTARLHVPLQQDLRRQPIALRLAPLVRQPRVPKRRFRLDRAETFIGERDRQAGDPPQPSGERSNFLGLRALVAAEMKRQADDELADFLISAAKHYEIDNKQIVALGYSNGANIAASMLLLRPEILSAAILFRAMVPLVPETTPDLSATRVLISEGDHDPIVSAAEAGRLAGLLRRAGADVTIRFFQSGHELTANDVDLAREWLNKLK